MIVVVAAVRFYGIECVAYFLSGVEQSLLVVEQSYLLFIFGYAQV